MNLRGAAAPPRRRSAGPRGPPPAARAASTKYWIALTGTPGTGKSTVAALLPAEWRPVEVGPLALGVGAGRRMRSGFEVDLRRLRARLPPPAGRPQVAVGHLAHLLPARAVVALRCDPRVLARRLRGRGTSADRDANLVCEAIDLVAAEARERGLPVFEIDTTHLPPEAVARRVVRWVRAGCPPSARGPRWLARRGMTDFLLAHAP